jgi:hypothetical protein
MNVAYPRIMIGLAAVVTAVLIFFGPRDGAEDVSLPAKTARPIEVAQFQAPGLASEKAPGTASGLDDMRRPELTQGAAPNLFGKGGWFVPPPPLPPPAPPPPPPPAPPPAPPPLPYAFLGKYSEGGMHLAILAKGNRVITAAPGELLENTYRLERIDSSSILFTYLPLGTTQTLSTGGGP